MKTKILLQLFLVIVSTSVLQLQAQDNEKANIFKASDQLYEAFNTMHTTAKFDTRNLKCNVEQIVKDYQLVFGQHTFGYTFNYVQETIDNVNTLATLVDKGNYATIFDKLFETFDSSKSYAEFTKDITTNNLTVKELPKDKAQNLRLTYGLLKVIHDGGMLTFHDADRLETGGCSDYTAYRLKLKKKNLGQVTWEIKTTVDIDCNCAFSDKKYDVDLLKFEYTAEISGFFTAKNKTFGKVKNPTLKVLRYQCCLEKEEKEEEPTKTALNDDEGIEDLMQNQTIGFGAGVGFSQDFDETTWCVTAEYLYQINTDEYKGWYVGGEVTHSNTSFNDFSSSRTVAGGKFQYNFSAVPSGETQFVAGLMANYAFGNNDFNGFKDDFNGTVFCVYGGANVRISEDWSIGLQFPVLIFENLTFKPESGGEFKTDATSLFINKDNPLKIVIRRSL